MNANSNNTTDGDPCQNLAHLVAGLLRYRQQLYSEHERLSAGLSVELPRLLKIDISPDLAGIATSHPLFKGIGGLEDSVRNVSLACAALEDALQQASNAASQRSRAEAEAASLASGISGRKTLLLLLTGLLTVIAVLVIGFAAESWLVGVALAVVSFLLFLLMHVSEKKSAKKHALVDSALYENEKQALAFAETTREELAVAWHALISRTEEGAKSQLAAIDTELKTNAREWHDYYHALPPFVRCAWDASEWAAPLPKSPSLPDYVVTGHCTASLGNPDSVFSYPRVLSFIGHDVSLSLLGAKNVSLMHGIILQLAANFGRRARFSLLNPSGERLAFPMQNKLPENLVRKINNNDVSAGLGEIDDERDHIITNLLGGKRFEQLAAQTPEAVRYEFIFAANYPDGYDTPTIECLAKLAKNGPAAGKYVFFQLASSYKKRPATNTIPVNTDSAPFTPLPGMSGECLSGPKDDGVMDAILEAIRNATAALSKPWPQTDFSGDWWKNKGDDKLAAVQVGEIYNALVTDVTGFGVFAECVPGSEGLCLINELTGLQGSNPSGVCKAGDTITVKCLSVDGGNIRLSMRDARKDNIPSKTP